MEFQLSYFKSWKMMLWKCYTQYASKFGKFPVLSSGQRTGKGQFSFQSQRKAMAKNAQTTTQLHASHTLVKRCLKFSKPGFSNMQTSRCSSWIWKRQRNQRSNCQHPLDHRKSKGISEKNIYFCFIDYYRLKPLTVWITTKYGKVLKRWEYQTTSHVSRNLWAGQEATVGTGHGTMD